MTEIVKFCKKHGELEEKDTYFLKSKLGKMTRMCSICKRGYRNDWAKLNPEKVKLSQEKNRLKRLEELAKGTLTKICKRHGALPIEKIRIDVRGTRVCKLCDGENTKSYKNKDPDKYRKRAIEWLHSDPERKRRYREKDKPKRRIRQSRLYAKWRKIPEKNKRMRDQSEKSRKKAIANLSDSYVSSLIKDIKRGHNTRVERVYLKNVEIPREIIEVRKLQIKINRELRKQRKQNNGD